MMKTAISLLVLALAMCGIPSEAQNLLSNDSFESGSVQQYGSGTIPGWNTWGTSGFQHQDFAHTGTFAVKSWWDDTGIFQDFTATGGLSYDISAWAFNPSNDAATGKDALLKVEWYDGSGLLGVTEVGKFFGDGVDPLDTWKEISTTAVAPTGATYGRVAMHIQANANPMQGGVVGWDDVSVSLSQIPEPSTVALLGLGLAGILGVVCRRK